MASKRRLLEESLRNLRDLVAPGYAALLDMQLCLEAKLDAGVHSIQEYSYESRRAKAAAPKPKKPKAKAGVEQRTSQRRQSSKPTRLSTSRRLTRATARASQLAKASKESVAAEVGQATQPSSGDELDAEVGQENVEPSVAVSSQAEVARPPVATTPAAARQSLLQRTPLQTRSQTRQQQSGERRAQLAAPGTPKGQQLAVPKAIRALQMNSPAKHSPARTRQLFSPYAKCSVQEKAMAFEQKLAPPTPPARTPSKATPKAAAVPAQVVTSRTITRKPLGPSSPSATRVTRSSSASSSTLTSGGDDSDWMESPEKLALPLHKPKTAPRSGTKVAVISLFPGKTAAASSKVAAALKPATSLVPLTKSSTGQLRAGPSSRVSPEPSRKRFHSKSPESSRKRPSTNIPDSEKKRKEELLRAKTEAAKMDRERRLALAQAARQQKEAKKREAELMRVQMEHEREQERLKKRTEFHLRKQSERSLEVSTLAAAHKRKADSPAFNHAPKLLPSAPKNPRTQGKPDAEAARLLFGQPNTSLSQKAKLNQSLQQQAMLNSLSMTLKSQASAEEAELPKAQENDSTPCAAANATFTVGSGCPEAPETPVQNGTRPKSTSYDITPHHTELPPEPNKQPENYDIDDLDSGDDTDDDDQPRKEVPTWAKSAILNGMIREQHWTRPHGAAMFGRIPDLDLGKVFSVPKKYFYKRTSSAVWDKMYHEQSFSGAA